VYTVYQRTVASDLAFEPVHDAAGRAIAMSLAAYQALAQSPDREARKRAYESLRGGLGRHKATVAATLAACIGRNVTLARLRGYTLATEMALAAQQVPVATYRAFLDAARAAAAPLIQRLMRTRGRTLGVDRLRAYDLTAPLDTGDAPDLSFTEGRALILDALRPLGAEYGAIIERAFAGRWIDWANTLGKPHGAFVAPIYAVHAYIWLPWQGTPRDVFLLAHELGHAGHFDLTRRHQTYGNTVGEQGRGLFLETPSTVNELLLGRHMLDTVREPGLRRRALLQVLDTFLGAMAVALGGAHLEQRLYDMAEGERLSPSRRSWKPRPTRRSWKPRPTRRSWKLRPTSSRGFMGRRSRWMMGSGCAGCRRRICTGPTRASRPTRRACAAPAA